MQLGNNLEEYNAALPWDSDLASKLRYKPKFEGFEEIVVDPLAEAKTKRNMPYYRDMLIAAGLDPENLEDEE